MSLFHVKYRKIRPTLGPIIIELNGIERIQFFSAERGGHWDRVEP